MHAPKAAVWLLSLAVVCLWFSPAFAQVLPDENHYKMYECDVATIYKAVVLRDQFGIHTVTTLTLNKFATPAMKDEYPIIDPEAHQDWWNIFIPEPPRSVIVTDQFGTSPWTTYEAVYLVTPAKKYPLPTDSIPPDRNHYLCYRAIGPNPNRYVVLTDQFGTQQVFVSECKFLCNPVEKIVDGVLYPIKDPKAHLACYYVSNPLFFGIPVTSLDQFGIWTFVLENNLCMCNPALKEEVVRTDKSTWGRIKALYH
jgi:hypothetical protein